MHACARACVYVCVHVRAQTGVGMGLLTRAQVCCMHMCSLCVCVCMCVHIKLAKICSETSGDLIFRKKNFPLRSVHFKFIH